MLSRSQAKTFFIGGTILCTGAFTWLTIDSFHQIPEITNQDEMSEEVVQGKHLFDESNCMGCHTLLGEGGYYAPELTKVYERRGPAFIRSMLTDPHAMYPGQRKMQTYELTEQEKDAMIAFFEWIGRIDTNGFPPDPTLMEMAQPTPEGGDNLAPTEGRPQVFNQMCVACHALGGQGGNVGPALDEVGERMAMDEIEVWLENPKEVRPGTTMPDLPLNEAQIRELAAFLSKLGDEPELKGPPPEGASPEDPADDTPAEAEEG